MCLDADVPWSMTSLPPQFASPSTTFHFLHTFNSQCSPAKGHHTVAILPPVTCVNKIGNLKPVLETNKDAF